MASPKSQDGMETSLGQIHVERDEIVGVGMALSPGGKMPSRKLCSAVSMSGKRLGEDQKHGVGQFVVTCHVVCNVRPRLAFLNGLQ